MLVQIFKDPACVGRRDLLPLTHLSLETAMFCTNGALCRQCTMSKNNADEAQLAHLCGNATLSCSCDTVQLTPVTAHICSVTAPLKTLAGSHTSAPRGRRPGRPRRHGHVVSGGCALRLPDRCLSLVQQSSSMEWRAAPAQYA